MIHVVGNERSLGRRWVGIAPAAWTALKRYRGDIQGVEKCLLLWRISILGGAFKQEKARRKEKKNIYIYILNCAACFCCILKLK